MARSKYISTHGIILDKRLHRDEKAIYIVVLTSDLGKIDVLVRGARKDTHKWGASFEPLEGGEMILYPIGDRYVLTAAQVDTLPPKLLRKYPMLRMGIATLVDSSVMKDSESYAEWDTLVSFLHSKMTGKTAIAKFLLEYIGVMGYRVFMSGATCGICGKEYDEKEMWYYTPYEGYLVCEQCNVIHGVKLGTYTISNQVLKEIVRLKKLPWHYSEDFISEDAYRLILDRTFATIPVSESVKHAFYSFGGKSSG
ncbi:MAG: hypothetical protein GXO59_03150 [Dictyoglomi bacterium]|nr:hypothetical protein [Dictyoglomota bacterium]